MKFKAPQVRIVAAREDAAAKEQKARAERDQAHGVAGGRHGCGACDMHRKRGGGRLRSCHCTGSCLRSHLRSRIKFVVERAGTLRGTLRGRVLLRPWWLIHHDGFPLKVSALEQLRRPAHVQHEGIVQCLAFRVGPAKDHDLVTRDPEFGHLEAVPSARGRAARTQLLPAQRARWREAAARSRYLLTAAHLGRSTSTFHLLPCLVHCTAAAGAGAKQGGDVHSMQSVRMEGVDETILEGPP